MGLLDELAGDPQFQLGLGLLAAGGPGQGSTGQRIAGALQGWQAQQDALQDTALKRKLMQSQLDENASQAAYRTAQLGQLQRQQDLQATLLGIPTAGGGTSTASGATAALTPTATASAGALGTPAAGGNTLASLSEQYRVPLPALQYDLVFNGGKGIAEMVAKRGTPDMQVVNGYAYDKNQVKPGFLPALNTSQDGKSTLTLPDPATGIPSVMPTPGAVGAFSAFQDAQGRAQANWTPETVLGANGERVIRPRSAVLGGQPTQGPSYSSPGLAGGSTASAATEQIAVMKSELAKMAPNDPDRPAVEREIQRLSGQPAPMVTAGNVVELSPTQQTANEAARVRAVDTAKADVTRDSARQAAQKMQGQIGAAATLAGQLLDQGPTGSGAGALVDKAANFFGMTTKGGDVAQQLEALSGWMVANVPRMEGPQSNADVLNYQTMAGRVGDRSLPISARKAALQIVMQLQAKYADLNAGSGDAAPPATPAQSATNSGAPKTFQEAGYSNEKQVIQDAQNTIMRNPKARPEVERRLKSIGLSLPGATGSW